MKKIGVLLLTLVIVVGLWLYIDNKENDCLSAGICPQGYQFDSCDWESCVVDKNSCQGRGYWDENKETCFFNNIPNPVD